MLRLMPYILILLFVLGACSPEEEKRSARSNLERSAPQGSKILEHVPTGYGGNTGYLIYEFRGECFMLYVGLKHRSMTRINCK